MTIVTFLQQVTLNLSLNSKGFMTIVTFYSLATRPRGGFGSGRIYAFRHSSRRRNIFTLNQVYTVRIDW